jgi:hypothetical protein
VKSIFQYFSKICPENSSFVNLTKITGISLEGFAATEFKEIFSGREPRQDGGLVWSKPPAHPTDGTGVSPQNVGKPPHFDAAVCSRKFL